MIEPERMVVAKRRGNGELVFDGERVSVLQDEKVLENGCTRTCT